MKKDTTSTATRIKATKQLRTDYRSGTKKQKSPIIDQICTPTGAGRWSARHYLSSPTLKDEFARTLGTYRCAYRVGASRSIGQ